MTTLEKEKKKALQSLKRLQNKMRADFSFGHIKTWLDYWSSIGWRQEDLCTEIDWNTPITFKELKDELSKLETKLETWYAKEEQTITDASIKDGGNVIIASTIPSQIYIKDIDTIVDATKKVETEHDKDYGLPPNKRRKCNLFWFQKKHAKELIDGITIYKRKAQMVVAAAGHGKTFILGEVISQLFESGWFKGKTISAWPAFYITKASVVEQTKRVLERQFSIDTTYECTVTNYDKLRATLGELYLTEKKIVEYGVEHFIWEWKPMIHPILFVIDECQAAKNEPSTQSKIIRAIHKIPSEHVHCIFSSATPFTRVSEAGYFVLNSRLDDKLY